ncbi:cell wall elongation regulator TseB-like domain-containing protein [Paenibacillus bouchesdurhonensis]|uniref:cell wall elongation regulator TseB-like domain-containing protein n=1 Tax=Paenibacillus bouchesdurhonensis TaxID=1870990 RepID=UPI000DA62876|nr:DUF5590 domain-containing protein [Paenibacillus bouchesdurhonensis]
MKKRTKWILLSILILLLVLFGLHRFYVYIQQDTWSEEKSAIQSAKQQTGIISVDKTWKSVWDEVCWVIQGKNENGEELMVWLPASGEAHEELLSSGKSEQQIRSIINESLPGIRIVRLMPGIYENEYVWQLFYKEKEHHYYQFFRFSDGSALPDKFTLPNR